jgi:MFS family permease
MATVAVVLAVVDLTGIVQLWMLYVIVFVYGLFLSVDNPTRQSFTPELVPAAELPNAIGLMSANMQVSRVLGPAVAGVLIVALGTGACFVINAVSFVFVIAALVALRPADLNPSVRVARAKGQVRDGFRYVWHTPELRSILFFTLIVGTFAINSPVILPVLTKVTFHGNAAVYSWMTIAMGTGAMVGALVFARRSEASERLLIGAGVCFGTAMCVAALAPALAIFIGLLLLVGAGQISVLSTTNSLLQLRSDPAMRGRVMGLYTITIVGTTPIGGPLMGWIAEQFGPRWAYGMGGLVTIAAAAVFGTVLLRERRRGEIVVEHHDVVMGVDGEVITASIR